MIGRAGDSDPIGVNCRGACGGMPAQVIRARPAAVCGPDPLGPVPATALEAPTGDGAGRPRWRPGKLLDRSRAGC